MSHAALVTSAVGRSVEIYYTWQHGRVVAGLLTGHGVAPPPHTAEPARSSGDNVQCRRAPSPDNDRPRRRPVV